MDAPEAREHLEMVEEILQRGNRPLPFRPLGWMLIALGVAAATIDCGLQIAIHGGAQTLLHWGEGLMLAAYAVIIAASVHARRNAERVSLAATRMLRASGAIWIGVLAAAFSQGHIFTDWAAAAIWSIGGGIQCLMAGFFGDRRMLAGGVLILASVIAADHFSGVAGYILAGGFVAGYVVPGILDVTQRNDCG